MIDEIKIPDKVGDVLKIALEMEVDLPRPRHEDTRYLPEFSKMAHQLRESIAL